MNRSWVRCDIPKAKAARFNAYLRGNGIKYEPSENGNLIHFECLMSETEVELANYFIDKEC